MHVSKKLVACLAAAITVAAGSAAFAAIPDSNGVIHTCYGQAPGTWRPIDTEAGQKCKSSETQLDINQQGPQGNPGPQGNTGPQGPAGPEGPSGLSGYQHLAAASALDSTSPKHVSVSCPAGKVKIAGGASVYDSPTVALTQSYPGGPGLETWEAEAREMVPTDEDWAMSVEVICVDAP